MNSQNTAARERHPMIEALLSLKGNVRACVYTEPLWGIPYNLYTPFATLYMYKLGISDTQIGLIVSAGLIIQAITAFLSGPVTDKYGRRWTTFIFDGLAWTIPCIIWAFAQNFWWFLIAALVNGIWQMTANSWHCLMVEDADKNQLVHIYTWVTISGMLAVFFAPLSSVLVQNVGVVAGMRWLYIFAAVFMTAKFVVLYIYSTETGQGRIRQEETKNIPLKRLVFGSADVFRMILKSPETVTTIVLMVIFNIVSVNMTTFFTLYANRTLGVPEQFIVAFPMIRAGIMLLFFFFLQRRIRPSSYKVPMLIGVVFYITGHALLLSSPSVDGMVPAVIGYAMMIGYVVFEAFAHALTSPRRESLLVLNIDESQRARILGIVQLIIIGFSTPFGYLNGFFSDINPVYPFMLNICLFVVIFAIIFFKIQKEYVRPVPAEDK